MVLSIWGVFQALRRWAEGADEEPSDEADEGGFVPSPLDLSVRVGHGGSDDTAVRELSEIEEQANELEKAQRNN